MIIFQNGIKFTEYKYNYEEDFEKEIISNSKLFFGKNTIYIEAKRKLEAKALGGTIPDGFLFDLSDKDNPDFYLVEVELSTHDFYNHIFPQVTKFFAFFKNSKSQTELVEKIFSIVNTDLSLKKMFKKHLGEREIYKFIKDVIENSQNILMIIDGDKDELPEIIETYSDTWGKMVRVLILKKFVNDGDVIYSLTPDFEQIEYAGADSVIKVERSGAAAYTEEFHLDGVNNEVKEVYFKLKEELLKINKNLIFNPQKYYISIVRGRNVAFFKFRKKKIRLVVMLPEDEVRMRLKNHDVIHLSDGIQKFYNGPCCDVQITNTKDIAEVINLLKVLVSTNSSNEIHEDEKK